MKQHVPLSRRSSKSQSARLTYPRLAREAKRFTSRVHSRSSILDSISRARLEISEIVQKCVSNRGILHYEDKAATVTACDFHRMLSEWSRTSSIDKAIRNLLISAFYSTEAKVGGSGIIAAMLFADHCELLETKDRPSEKSVIEMLKFWQPGGISSKVAEHSFYMGGCGCEVKLVEGKHFGTEIKCFSGTSQTGYIDRIMASKLSQDFLLQQKMYVIAIDGIVESIGEIHNLLEESGGEDTIIMARGFLPDVTNTLAENYGKKLRCIPFVTEGWCVDHFLELRELGLSCVSQETGDVISSASLSKKIDIAISLDRVIISGGPQSKRKIKISFGEDLGALKGIALDRTKLLISLFRFTSRKGLATLKYNDWEFFAPVLSYDAAKKCNESLEKNLFSVEKIITYKKEKVRRNKRYVRKKSRKSSCLQNYLR